MRWYEVVTDDDPYHRLHVLLNDKTDVLARIETFDGGQINYPWVMDIIDPTLLRRIGPACRVRWGPASRRINAPLPGPPLALTVQGLQRGLLAGLPSPRP